MAELRASATMTAHRTASGYDLVELDADGVGGGLLGLSNVAGTADMETMSQAARLLVVARAMPGGWRRAIALCKGETDEYVRRVDRSRALAEPGSLVPTDTPLMRQAAADASKAPE